MKFNNATVKEDEANLQGNDAANNGGNLQQNVEQQQPEKKRRGRPTKAETEARKNAENNGGANPPEQGAKTAKKGGGSIDDILDSYNQQSSGTAATNPNPNIPALPPTAEQYKISGLMMLGLIDILLPPMVILGVQFIDDDLRELEVRAADIKLSSTQLKQLEKIADAVAAKFFAQTEPEILLLIGLAGCYAGNISEAKVNKKLKQKLLKEKKDEKKEK